MKYSVIGTFNKALQLLLIAFFGKNRIDNYTSPLTLLKLTFNGFVAIILVVMIRNLYPLFLNASRVLNLGWEIDSIQAQLVAHSFAIVLLGLMLASLVIADKLIFAKIEGENGKNAKIVIRITAIVFTVIFALCNMYQFAQKDVSKNVDKSKFAKIETFDDKSTKSFDKQIDRLESAYKNEVAVQKENLDKAALLQKRSNVNVIGNVAVQENRLEIQRYEATANVHFIESQSILDKIQKLENQKAENILVLKDMNKAIDKEFQNELSYYEWFGYAKGGLLEVALFLCLAASFYLGGVIAQYNTVKSKVSVNETQRNKTITQSNSAKEISLPKLPKVKIPKLNKKITDKLKFKNFSLFEQEEVVPIQNKVDISSMIDKDIEINDSKTIESNYNTIWSCFKDLGLQSGLITKYTQLKKQEQQDIMRFVVDLDVKNFKGKEMSLENFASMIEGVYENKINAKDLVNEVKIMKSKFIHKDRLTKSKMLKVSELESEIVGGVGQKTLF